MHIGRYAFITPKDGYLVDINNKGAVTFSFKIPKPYNRTLRTGVDDEYLTVHDRFLVVVPRKGILEIDRSRGIVWSCDTPYVSHDVDSLPDDTLIFVNGLDDENKNESTYAHMARDCTVLSQLFASNLNLDKSRFSPDNPKKSNPKKRNLKRLLICIPKRSGQGQMACCCYQSVITMNLF